MGCSRRKGKKALGSVKTCLSHSSTSPNHTGEWCEVCPASHLAGDGNRGSGHPCQLQHTPRVWSHFTAARHRKYKYRFLYPLKRPVFKFNKEEKVRHGFPRLHSLHWGAWDRRTVKSSGLAWATEHDPGSLFHFLPHKQIRAESPDLTLAFSGCFWAVRH